MKIWLFIALLAQISAHGAPVDTGKKTSVVEDVQARDLAFRGQGRTDICYAFAEEQLLKDALCTTPECKAGNASQWKYSIFDIANEHRRANGYTDGTITPENVAGLAGNGSFEHLPYWEEHRKISAAECTLEHDVFLLDRLYGVSLPEMFNNLYATSKDQPEFYSNPEDSKFEAQYHLENLFKILSGLAKESTSGADFMTKTIAYRSCDTKISLPPGRLVRRRLSTRAQALTTLDGVLKRGHSVLLAVCAFGLRSVHPEECGSHAITLKAVRQDQYLIVDSAFFSNAPREPDGSQWISKETVLNSAFLKLRTSPGTASQDLEADTLMMFTMVKSFPDSQAALSDDVVERLRFSARQARYAAKTFVQDLSPILRFTQTEAAELSKLSISSPEDRLATRKALNSLFGNLDEVKLFDTIRALIKHGWLVAADKPQPNAVWIE